jgi:hypothetical protein
MRVFGGSPVATSIRREYEFPRSVRWVYNEQSLRKQIAKLYTRGQTHVLRKSRIQFASLSG